MAEGFMPADYITDVRLSDLKGKRLWLVRVPRHIDAGRLEGAKLKLPRKGREGKLLGRATSRKDGDSSNGDGDGQERRRVLDQGLVFRAADSAESHGFRALFSTEEDGALGAAAPFAGQVNVSVETPSDSETSGVDGLASASASASASVLVEPYRGRPQLKGMRVRSKPAGAGSEYSPTRPLARDRPQIVGPGGDGDGDDAQLATPDREGGKKTQSFTAGSSSRDDEPQGMDPSAQTPKSSKKKKKRKSTTGGGDLQQEGPMAGGDGQSAKKSKKKKSAER